LHYSEIVNSFNVYFSDSNKIALSIKAFYGQNFFYREIIGTVFAFIPRFIWNDKPENIVNLGYFFVVLENGFNDKKYSFALTQYLTHYIYFGKFSLLVAFFYGLLVKLISNFIIRSYLSIFYPVFTILVVFYLYTGEITTLVYYNNSVFLSLLIISFYFLNKKKNAY